MRLKRGKSTVLVISDLQIPYEHPDALAFCKAARDRYEPDVIINVGDEVDQHAISRFDPDPEAIGPGPELRESIRRLKRWYTAFPDSLVCHSNHTQRVYHKAFHSGIPEAYLRPVNEWLEAPDGWRWDTVWEVDGVRYEHGDALGGMYAAKTLAERNRQSTVIGHHHNTSCIFRISNIHEEIFGMNVGCLIDIKSLAFKYGRKNPYKPTLGIGLVHKGVPMLLPMLTGPKGRWTRELPF